MMKFKNTGYVLVACIALVAVTIGSTIALAANSSQQKTRPSEQAVATARPSSVNPSKQAAALSVQKVSAASPSVSATQAEESIQQYMADLTAYEADPEQLLITYGLTTDDRLAHAKEEQGNTGVTMEMLELAFRKQYSPHFAGAVFSNRFTTQDGIIIQGTAAAAPKSYVLSALTHLSETSDGSVYRATVTITDAGTTQTVTWDLEMYADTDVLCVQTENE